MTLEMVLNELSLIQAADPYVAKNWMAILVDTIKEAVKVGVSRVVHIKDENIYSCLLAPNYTLGNWCQDPQVDREKRRYFMSLSTKSPLLVDLLEEVRDRVLLSEVFCDGEIAQGLGVAFFLNHLAISLPSESRWGGITVNLQVVFLHEDESKSEEEGLVHHASQVKHIQKHQEWINESLCLVIHNGDELWERREELFSSLTFCVETEKQIRGVASWMLRSVIGKLFELERYCQRWNSGPFDKTDLLNVDSDGPTTLHMYAQERTFHTPDGEEVIFRWHMRLTPDAWRLYFEPSKGTGKMLIGHIGPHLRTKKFP